MTAIMSKVNFLKINAIVVLWKGIFSLPNPKFENKKNFVEHFLKFTDVMWMVYQQAIT